MNTLYKRTESAFSAFYSYRKYLENSHENHSGNRSSHVGSIICDEQALDCAPHFSGEYVMQIGQNHDNQDENALNNAKSESGELQGCVEFESFVSRWSESEVNSESARQQFDDYGDEISEVEGNAHIWDHSVLDEVHKNPGDENLD